MFPQLSACPSYHISIYKCISISAFLWKFTMYKNKIYYSRKVMTCRNLHMKRPVSKKWSNEHAIEFDWQAKFVTAWSARSIKKRTPIHQNQHLIQYKMNRDYLWKKGRKHMWPMKDLWRNVSQKQDSNWLKRKQMLKQKQMLASKPLL